MDVQKKKKRASRIIGLRLGGGDITFLSQLVGDFAHYTSFALQVGKVRNPCFKK